jgi:YHS domain-containing protein
MKCQSCVHPLVLIMLTFVAIVPAFPQKAPPILRPGSLQATQTNTMNSDSIYLQLLVAIVLILVIANAVHSQDRTTEAKHYNIDKSGLALEGYDPISYFLKNKAVEGKKEYAAKVDGIIYYFESASNRDLFTKNPQKYKPQFGGWCAYAMGATGEKVEVDPETFKILDGKLYLFYNKYFNNTLKTWNKDESALKTKAEKNWASIITDASN